MSGIEHLKYEALTYDQQELADLVGIDCFKDIVRAYGGTNLYIPRLETLERAARNAKIKSEFDGSNYKLLARKYAISEVWVRKIVSG